MAAPTAERVFLEGEEDGWELVIDTADEIYAGPRSTRFRVNVHGLASSGELRDQLLAIVAQLDDQGRG